MVFINIVSLYLLLVTVATISCAVQVKTLNGSDYTKTTLLLCFAICFYILAYTMELNSSSPSQILFWNRIEYFGIPFVSALWFTTALQYTGRFIRHKRALMLAIYIIPIITLVLRLTNSFHHFYFASESYTEGFGKLLFLKTPGPWMYVQLLHSMLMIMTSMVVFSYDSAKSAEKQAGKILLIAAASLFAIAGLILTLVKPFGLQIDYMALCLPITCVLVILAILRYDLLETLSVARVRVFEASSDAILMINCQNRVLDFNKSAKELFEQLDIHLNKVNLSALFGKNTKLLERLTQEKSSVIDLQINSDDRYFEITTENIDDRNIRRGLIKTVRDVTEIYRLNAELKKMALTDELSALSNRRAFLDIGRRWVTQSEDTGKSLYLLMMDLDHFKNVNDQYGHPAGDLVIRDFAQILKSLFGEECLIARLGGEEFAVMLAGFNDGEIIQKVDTLLNDSMKYVYSYMGNRFYVTVSIGVTKKKPGQGLEIMMRKADKGLYQSKDKGRGCYTFL